MFQWFGRICYSPHTKVAAFARYLKDGRLMASRCRGCGQLSFPPRADCPRCLGGEFEFTEISGEGTLLTYTRIEAAPAGFEELAPYVLGVLDLKEGGRLLAWFGATVDEAEIEVGMPLQAVPRLFEELPDIHVHYSLEKLGTTWARAEGD